jgi:pimeloyl-ACP methyl ester carboxylesterase
MIVAGHSYGGQIATALGTGAPDVAGLVHIAAFGLDEGESLGAPLSQGPDIWKETDDGNGTSLGGDRVRRSRGTAA